MSNYFERLDDELNKIVAKNNKLGCAYNKVFNVNIWPENTNDDYNVYTDSTHDLTYSLLGYYKYVSINKLDNIWTCLILDNEKEYLGFGKHKGLNIAICLAFYEANVGKPFEI